MSKFYNKIMFRNKELYKIYLGTQVVEDKPCTGIILDKDNITFTTNDSQTLTYVTSPIDTTDKVIWNVNPSGIIGVNNGVITPIQNGSCTIKVTCGNYSDTCNVTVNIPVVKPCTGIILDKDNITFTDNNSQTLTYVTNPTDTTDKVVWSIVPEGIVDVVNGVVTPITNGECKISVQCGEYIDNCSVTVNIPNENEVPYISTYYIKPIVKPDEEVIIDYYISDYYHKEYVDDDYTDTFKVIVRIDGKEDIIINDLQAGDHSVNLGTFPNLDGEEQKFSMLCTDQYGRNSHELFNFFLVRNDVAVNEYIMTEEDLTTYNIKNDDDHEIFKLITVDIGDLDYKSDEAKSIVDNALQTAYDNETVPSNKYVIFAGDSNNDGIEKTGLKRSLVKYSTDYDKDAVELEAQKTKEGLQQLLDDKQAEGYNKLKLLQGTYRIDHLSPIYIPTNLTLDMNGATLKLNEFTGASAFMMDMNYTFDSHVINGVIEGDYYNHDYDNSPNNSEWVNAINISGESKYSSYENMTIKDITGYGQCNGFAKSRDSKLDYTYFVKRIGSFILGDIDRNTGLSIESSNRTTSDFVDISECSKIGYLAISRYLGYEGISGGTCNLICHFYDENKNFIKSTDAYQYRKVAVPNNAKYMKVTLLSTECPTDLTINLFRAPMHCAYKNLKFDNCRCVGMAPAAMNNFLFEDCEISNSGQKGAHCALDAEGGGDKMQDVTFRRMNFHDNPNNDFLTVVGHNFIVENQINGSMYIWHRTRNLIVKNSNLNIVNIRNNGLVSTGIPRFINNSAQSITFAPSNTDFINNSIVKDCQINGALQNGIAYNSTFTNNSKSQIIILKNATYNDCTFLNMPNILLNEAMYLNNCEFDYNLDEISKISLMINTNGSCGEINNCIFKKNTLLTDCSGKTIYNGCDFNNVDIVSYASNTSTDSLFDSCNFVHTTGAFINLFTPTYFTFKDCTITDNSSEALVYLKKEPSEGKTIFKDCTIKKENGVVLDGYGNPRSTNENANYEVILDNSPVSVELTSKKYINLTYYKTTVL